MTIDFTLEKYSLLCRSIIGLGIPIMTIKEYLTVGQPEEFIIIIRHDVDRLVDSAINMAELENALGIQSTYYFRMNSSVFQPAKISKIGNLGHEVGYHYETLAKARGDKSRAINLFKEELDRFREIVPIETVSMHGSPLTPWNNLDLWNSFEYRNFSLIGEAYLSVDYSKAYYFSDTGRSWEDERFNIRDHTNSKTPSTQVSTTDELITFLCQKNPYPVFISAHPNRWANSWNSWVFSVVTDRLINQAKLFYLKTNKRRK
jgi:hypothetical protein